MSKLNEQEYWMCIIGPIEKKKLNYGADAPLRNAVQTTFDKMFEYKNTICYSGWA